MRTDLPERVVVDRARLRVRKLVKWAIPVVSNEMSHDTNFVQTFLWKFWNEYIQRTPYDQTQFKSVHIESDGAASHFKQRYSLEALTQFQNDYGLRRCGRSEEHPSELQ